ncbi:MAG: hypothetical protein ISR45_02585 [Rhodospirillales bacterium]|nr:hypothetical protein [Rhodospirillales bacterium]
MTELSPPKGVKMKLFGVSLIILASLNLMVSWRGSLDVNLWQVLILGIGFFFYAIGAAKGASRPQSDVGEKV